MENYKNRLQEHYQKRFPYAVLPTYEHESGNFGSWVSVLTLPNGEGQFRGFGATKKEADQSAAAQALSIQSPPSVSVPPSVLKQGKALVLIDLENSPNYDKASWARVLWPASVLEAFVGKMSSHAKKDLPSLYPFIGKFHIVNSAHKDAVDHAISVRAGEWLESYRQNVVGTVGTDMVFIVSRDRFAPALVDVLRQRFSEEEKVKVFHCVDMDECFTELTQKMNNV